jgi:hypothetical protein
MYRHWHHHCVGLVFSLPRHRSPGLQLWALAVIQYRLRRSYVKWVAITMTT